MNNKVLTSIKTKVIVIGAGIAGSSIAGDLTRLGYEVHLYDKNLGPAKETSAHETALAHPQVGKKISKLQRFTQLANQLANQKWKKAQQVQEAFEPLRNLTSTQLGQLPELLDEMGLTSLEAQILTAKEAALKTNVSAPGLWFPTAAVYSLPRVCEIEVALLDEGQTHWNCHIKRIRQENHLWQLIDQDEDVIGSAPILILAGGLHVQDLLKTIDIHLPLRPVRGQITTFKIKTESLLMPHLPKKAIRGDGYCMPATRVTPQEWHWEIGSSYDEDQSDISPWLISDQENALKAMNLIGCDHTHLNELVPVHAFAGIRSASKDRLPLIGPIPKHPGLFVACAYGSRGVLWSALAAPLMTAYVDAFFAGADRLRAGFLTGATSTLASEVASAVNPGRFLRGVLATRASNSKPIFPVS